MKLVMKDKAMDSGDQTSTSWKKYRTLKTLALYLSFVGLGLSASINGPVMVSMQYLLNTDTKSYSAAFSGGAFGYLVGAITLGFIYAPMNKELLFATALFGVGMAVALAPFAWHLALFVTACVVQGFFMGWIDAAGQPYILKLWEGHRWKDPLMQAVHFTWSIGSTVGPFIISPFLVDVRMVLDSMTYNSTTPSYDNHSQNVIFTESSINTTQQEFSVQVELVRYAFIIIASLIFVCSTLFIITFFLMEPSCKDRYRLKNSTGPPRKFTKEYRRFRVFLLMFTAFFYFVLIWLECLPGNYLTGFVVKGLGWHNRFGSIITAVYWGSHGTGRLLGIPIAMRMSARNMLFMDMTCTLIGFTLLLFVPYLEVLVWVGIILAGLGIGTIFPTGILWLENYLEFTGVASSLLLTSCSLGGIVSPIVTGLLFERYGHMIFTYVVFAASIFEFAIFCGLLAYANKYGKCERYVEERKTSESSSADDVAELEHLNEEKLATDEGLNTTSPKSNNNIELQHLNSTKDKLVTDETSNPNLMTKQ